MRCKLYVRLCISTTCALSFTLILHVYKFKSTMLWSVSKCSQFAQIDYNTLE